MDDCKITRKRGAGSDRRRRDRKASSSLRRTVSRLRELFRVQTEERDDDAFAIGAPIYFGRASAVTLAFMERLLFPLITYDPKIDPETGEVAERGISLYEKATPTALIYSMGMPKEKITDYNYPQVLGTYERFMKEVYGSCESLSSCCGYQFSDYSKYVFKAGVEETRAKYREEEFPKDLQNAYELGQRLVEKARS